MPASITLPFDSWLPLLFSGVILVVVPVIALCVKHKSREAAIAATITTLIGFALLFGFVYFSFKIFNFTF